MVDLQVGDGALRELTRECRTGAADRQSREALVGEVILAEGVIHLEPRRRLVFEAEVSDDAIHVGQVLLLVLRPQRVFVDRVLDAARIRAAIGPCQAQVREVRELVEFR